MSLRVFCFLLMSPFVFCSSAAAGVISVNFSTGEPNSLNSFSVEGVVASRYWNNAVSAPRRAGRGTIENLSDSNGAASGASFSYQAAYVNSNGNARNGMMMDAWAANGAGDSPNAFTFRALPAPFLKSGYDVYVYYDSQAVGGIYRFAIGEDSVYGAEPARGQFDGHFVEARGGAAVDATVGNYVVFRDLSAASFSLVVSARSGRGAVNGIQVVSRARPQPPAALPNVVFILADDFGWTDIRSWGSDYYLTPHLDRLSEQGMRFPQAYAFPNCMPFRAALMSGQYAPRTGVYTVNNGNRGQAGNRRLDAPPNRRSLDFELVTLAESLRLGGYATGHFGKWHMGGENEGGYPTAQGFEVNFGGADRGVPPQRNGSANYFADANGAFAVPHLEANGIANQYVTDRLTTEALDWLEEEKDRPFFLYFSHFSVHLPKQAKADDIAFFNRLPRGERHNDSIYAAMIKAMDDSIGAVVDYLETTDSVRSPGRKLIDNTMVIFYSDNGGVGGYSDIGIRGANEVTRQAPLRSGKGSLYEGGVRVPFMIRWDGQAPAGTVNETPVAPIDWYPTLLALAGVEAPGEHVLDGENLLPLFRDPAASLPPRPLFWHFPCYTQASTPLGTWRSKPCSVILSGDWKLHYYYEDERYELYNLALDIGEADNLAETRPEVQQALARQLRAWLVETEAALPSVQATGRRVGLPPVVEALHVRGDCDGNGEVNITDPICVLQYLFLDQPAQACFRSSDADGNGELNITDPIYLLNYLFSGGAPPVDPFPLCGPFPDAPLPGENCKASCP